MIELLEIIMSKPLLLLQQQVSCSPPHRRLRKNSDRVTFKSDSSPPHRRLRKLRARWRFPVPGSPPHRRLRKVSTSARHWSTRSPPHRRLRKLLPRDCFQAWSSPPHRRLRKSEKHWPGSPGQSTVWMEYEKFYQIKWKNQA